MQDMCYGALADYSITLTNIRRYDGGKEKVGSPRRSWMKDILEWIDWNDKNNTGEKTVHVE